jgi:UDP:flavonoid glycosyltransferase YjiC (YdhE family)
MGLTAAVHAPGLNREQMASDFDGVEILDGPLALHTILHSFDAVAHHGGSLGHHCLAAGLPQVFFPWQLEQYAAMKPAAERGYGILVGRKAALRKEVLQRAFRTALDRRSRESAKRKALEISDRQNYITPEALAGEILACFAGRSMD